jgi:hypothetical protein
VESTTGRRRVGEKTKGTPIPTFAR